MGRGRDTAKGSNGPKAVGGSKTPCKVRVAGKQREHGVKMDKARCADYHFHFPLSAGGTIGGFKAEESEVDFSFPKMPLTQQFHS